MYSNISCIIRTYNEAKFISRIIESLLAQEVFSAELEIIVIDSGSTDGTVDMAKSFDVKVIEISKVEFNYSKALNLGIKRSIGDLIVILSAHSIPCENNWLHKMAAHFTDEKVAGVYCRQVPRPDASWHEVLRIDNTFANHSRVFCKGNRNNQMRFSNAASCIRRSIWERHRFVVLPAAEDHEWASWAVANGFKIVYDASACVYHSHDESCRKAARRQIELEKALDITLSRKRTSRLTVRQGLGMLTKGVSKTFCSGYCKGQRLGALWEVFVRTFWYIVDFNRNGN